MNSSNDQPTEHLAPPKSAKAERFLIELANLPDAGRIRRLQQDFGAWIPQFLRAGAAVELLPHRERLALPSVTDGELDYTDPILRERRRLPRVEKTAEALREGRYRCGKRPEVSEPVPRGRVIDAAEQEFDWIWTLCQSLRRVWEQPDRRTKEWGAFLLLLTTRAAAGARQVSLLGLDGPLPDPTLFEYALLHLTREADRARVCQNPECAVQRYFFAKRRSQKYCDDTCARPAQREAKRRWWADHGTTWREGRANGKKSNARRRKNRGK